MELRSEPEFMKRTGERLNHILDLIGFRVGRGRIPEFQEYLDNKGLEGLEKLKYSTVRSWFNNHAPPMKKINKIIDAFAEDYSCMVENSDQIKVWWKLGGIYPFKKSNEAKGINYSQDKLQFLITSIVTEASGDAFQALTSQSLINVKNKAIELALNYADPSKTDVPIDYLRSFIAEELRKNSD